MLSLVVVRRICRPPHRRALADGRLDEQGSDPGATFDGVERDDLQHVARNVIGEQAGQAAGPLGDEAGQFGGLEDGAVHGHRLRSP